MPKAILPHARSEGLVVTDLDDEILVYDKERDKAHCLNQTAALVWKYSDGKHTAAEIAARMQSKLRTSVDEQVVWFALRQLEQDHLLRDDLALPRSLAGITRREFVKKMGAVAVLAALPSIHSITAPNAPGALSCLPNGQQCTSSTQCCSQCCATSQVNPRGAGPAAIFTCQPSQNCG